METSIFDPKTSLFLLDKPKIMGMTFTCRNGLPFPLLSCKCSRKEKI